MIGVECSFEIGGVTGVAVRRHGLEFAVGGAFVAGIAIDGGVGSGQRKAVIVLLHLLDGNIPPAHGVTLLTIGAELALVNVGMAILAALADVGEDRLGVALGAGHGLMQAAKRIMRLVVIELRNGANDFPALRGMAVLTG